MSYFVSEIPYMPWGADAPPPGWFLLPIDEAGEAYVAADLLLFAEPLALVAEAMLEDVDVITDPRCRHHYLPVTWALARVPYQRRLLAMLQLAAEEILAEGEGIWSGEGTWERGG